MNTRELSTEGETNDELQDVVPRKRRMQSNSAMPLTFNPIEVNESKDGCIDASASEEFYPSDEGSYSEDSAIYMDYNATTPLDREVLAAIHKALLYAWGNPSSSHSAGKKAKDIIQQSRDQVATMIGASSDEIIFTSGGTESNNLVLNSAVEHFWTSRVLDNKDGSILKNKSIRPHIISSDLEHDSIKLVLQNFEEQGRADVTLVSASSKTGHVETDDIISAIRPETCLITVMLANNETGVVQPVAEIGSRISSLNKERLESGGKAVLFHTDAAQAIGKIPVNVDQLGVDYLTIVGHKFYGPRIGALYGKQLERKNGAPIYPMFYGGGQERNLRPGTENTGMIAGLGKACELVTKNIKRYEQHMRTVRNHLENQLELMFPNGIHINGRLKDSERIPNTCNVSVLGLGLEGNKVLSRAKRVRASVGAACHSDAVSRASPILLAIGIPKEVAINAVRLSIGRLSTLHEMELVVKDLKSAVDSILSESASS